MKNKRQNSDNLQAIQKALMDEEEKARLEDIEEEKKEALVGKINRPKGPIKFSSGKVTLNSRDNKEDNEKCLKHGFLPAIREDGDENQDDDKYMLPEKPSYFNMHDVENVDSEEELVAGENNYIEIDCLPLEPPAPVLQPAPVEEEKKEVANDSARSS